MLNYINNTILRQASKISYSVANFAPNTEQALFNESGLIIWSGASDDTFYQDCRVNWAFRALHDALHLKTHYDFSVDAEIALGKLQASKYSSQLMQDFVFCEVVKQAEYYRDTGLFVADQKTFTEQYLKGLGYV